jgi:hypothetical protein
MLSTLSSPDSLNHPQQSCQVNKLLNLGRMYKKYVNQGEQPCNGGVLTAPNGCALCEYHAGVYNQYASEVKGINLSWAGFPTAKLLQSLSKKAPLTPAAATLSLPPASKAQQTLPAGYKELFKNAAIDGFSIVQEISPKKGHIARQFLLIKSYQDLLKLIDQKQNSLKCFFDEVRKKQGIAGFLFETKDAKEEFAQWVKTKLPTLTHDSGSVKEYTKDLDFNKIKDILCNLNPDDNPEWAFLRKISHQKETKNEARVHRDNLFSVAIFVICGKGTIYVPPQYQQHILKLQECEQYTQEGGFVLNEKLYLNLEDPNLTEKVQELPENGIFFLGQTFHQTPVNQNNREVITFYGEHANGRDDIFKGPHVLPSAVLHEIKKNPKKWKNIMSTQAAQ